jgi:hypothetical protein
MHDYTVIGYYPDTLQRFGETYKASCPETAEKSCLLKHPDVAICGVVEGRLNCVDTSAYVAFGK